MDEEMRNYFRNLLKYFCFLQQGETLLVKIPGECKKEQEILRDLVSEFHLQGIFFLNTKNYQDIYNFLVGNPSDEEIDDFIKENEFVESKQYFGIIKVLDFSLSYVDYYYKQKLYYDIFDLYEQYLNIEELKNSSFYDKEKLNNKVYGIVPTKSLATDVTNGDVDMLWNYLFQMVPTEEIEEILTKIGERRNYLNALEIDKLHFETKKGSNFDIVLSKYSLWNSIGINQFFTNFPSYEIYTSSQMYSMHGKVIVTKSSNLYGNEVREVSLDFLNGLLVDCSSDNQFWKELIMNDDNRLRRVGEIALVADSPISKMNIYTNNILLDENAGCHIALGSYLDDVVKPCQLK